MDPKKRDYYDAEIAWRQNPDVQQYNADYGKDLQRWTEEGGPDPSDENDGKRFDASQSALASLPARPNAADFQIPLDVLKQSAKAPDKTGAPDSEQPANPSPATSETEASIQGGTSDQLKDATGTGEAGTPSSPAAGQPAQSVDEASTAPSAEQQALIDAQSTYQQLRQDFDEQWPDGQRPPAGTDEEKAYEAQSEALEAARKAVEDAAKALLPQGSPPAGQPDHSISGNLSERTIKQL